MVYPMRLKSEAPNALKCFLQDVGTPHVLHSNNAKDLMQGEWRKICNYFAIKTTYTEPRSPWQNRAKGNIRKLKRHIHRKMESNKVPKRLWSYYAKWSCDVIANNGNVHKRRTTKGWYLCVQWKDGSTSWEALKDLKESFPVQVAEFSIARGIQDEPAFSWWVKETVSRKHRIIKAMKTRYARKTHKYGMEMPKSTKEAYELDRISGTDYWHRAIIKEMTNNASAFKFLDVDESVPVGSTWIPCHMVFDVKSDLTRKARFVADGHWTDPLRQTTYSTVVSRDSIGIMFLIVALNDVDILSADIGNAYLNAPTKERVHTTAGPEFGPNRIGQTVVIVRALYGLKTSGAAWHSLLAESITAMGFQHSLADPDVWFRPATKHNGFEYYEYLIVYVDDILVLSHQAKEVMLTIEQLY